MSSAKKTKKRGGGKSATTANVMFDNNSPKTAANSQSVSTPKQEGLPTNSNGKVEVDKEVRLNDGGTVPNPIASMAQVKDHNCRSADGQDMMTTIQVASGLLSG